MRSPWKHCGIRGRKGCNCPRCAYIRFYKRQWGRDQRRFQTESYWKQLEYDRIYRRAKRRAVA